MDVFQRKTIYKNNSRPNLVYRPQTVNSWSRSLFWPRFKWLVLNCVLALCYIPMLMDLLRKKYRGLLNVLLRVLFITSHSIFSFEPPWKKFHSVPVLLRALFLLSISFIIISKTLWIMHLFSLPSLHWLIKKKKISGPSTWLISSKSLEYLWNAFDIQILILISL